MAEKTLIDRIARALASAAKSSSEIPDIVAVLHHSASRKRVLAALVTASVTTSQAGVRQDLQPKISQDGDLDAMSERLEELLRTRAQLTNAEAFKWLEQQTSSTVARSKTSLRHVLRRILRRLSPDERDNLIRAAFRLLADDKQGGGIENWWEEYDRRQRR